MAFGTSKPVQPQAAKSSFRPTGRGLLCCLLSRPGMGKSSLLAQIPNIKFICDSRDQGILDLMEYSSATKVRLQPHQVEICNTYYDLCVALDNAQHEEFTSFAIESIVGIQAFCEDTCLKEEYGGSSATYQAYRNGKDAAAMVYFQRILDKMIRLQSLNKNCFLTGHSRIGTGKAVSGEDWVSQVLESLPEVGRRVDATFQLILHIGSTISTVAPKGKVRATGMDTKIYCDFNPFFPAKNRMGLHDPIDYPADPVEAYRVVCSTLGYNPTTFQRA